MNLITNNWKLLLASHLIFAVLAIFFFRQIVPPPTIEKTIRDTTVVTERDTVFQTIRDTIELEIGDPQIISEGSSDTTVVRDTVYITSRPATRQYETFVETGYIRGTITSQVRGWLLKQDFAYRGDIPIQINVNNTTTITETNYLKPRPSIFIGGMVGGSRALEFDNLGPTIGFLSPNRWSASYTYDVIDQSHNVTLTRNIFTF